MLNLRAEVRLELQGLAAMRARASDLSPVMAGPVDKLVTAFTVAQFASEGAHGGNKWARLSPATLVYRKRPGHGRGGIGRDTNRMWSSLVKTPSPEGQVNVGPFSYSRTTSVMDRGKSYPRFFAEGTSRQPARPIYPRLLPAGLVRSVEAALSWYIAYGELRVGTRGSVLATAKVQ